MRKGFTLIELLVVVLIMGILASVAMPQYFKSVEKSRASEAIDALSAVVSSQERFYMQKGHYNTESIKYFDIDLTNLSYFTLTFKGGTRGNGAKYAQMQRLTMAGAGLGEYTIDIDFPASPGTGERSWSCSPTSAGCKSFLPI